MINKILSILSGSCLMLTSLSAMANLPADNSAPIVITGNHGTMVTSLQGVTWSQLPSLGKSAITTTMGHNAHYVALASDGCSLTSANGTAWRAHCSHAASRGKNKDILWADHEYLVLRTHRAESGIYASADGINWNPIFLTKTRGILVGMTYMDGTLFVVNGSPSCSHNVMKSHDRGKNWETKFYPMCIKGIASAEDKIILFGSIAHKMPAQSIIRISDKNMNGPEVTVGLPGQMINWVTLANNLYVAVGEDRNHKGILFTSRNGSMWAQQNIPEMAALSKVVWVNDQYIAFGQRGSILTSSDGERWTSQESTTQQDLYDIAW